MKKDVIIIQTIKKSDIEFACLFVACYCGCPNMIQESNKAFVFHDDRLRSNAFAVDANFNFSGVIIFILSDLEVVSRGRQVIKKIEFRS